MNDPVKIVDRTFMNGVATAIYALGDPLRAATPAISAR